MTIRALRAIPPTYPVRAFSEDAVIRPDGPQDGQEQASSRRLRIARRELFEDVSLMCEKRHQFQRQPT